MDSGHRENCEVPYNGGDCECASYWKERALGKEPMPGSNAQRIAELTQELEQLKAEEAKKFENHLRALLSGLIKMIPHREDQQTFRNMLTQHIKDTYDSDDE